VLFLTPLKFVHLLCNLSQVYPALLFIFHLCCCYSSGVPCFKSPSFAAI
jgi:hypothetical protein